MTTVSKVVPKADGRTLNVLGARVVLKLTQADTAGQFTILEQTNSQYSGISLHRHTLEDETFILLEGQLDFVIDGVVHTMRAGDIAFVARSVPYSYRVVKETLARMLIILTPSGIEGMFEELSYVPAGPPDVAGIYRGYGVLFGQ